MKLGAVIQRGAVSRRGRGGAQGARRGGGGGLCWLRGVVALAVAVAAVGIAGCEGPPRRGANGDVVAGPDAPLPSYTDVAERYNARLLGIESFFARASIRLRYVDPEGVRRTEQGEGTLQILMPDRLAMSLRKAGRLLFWFGGDQERYWWFDLVEDRVASIGRHENFDRAARQQLGLAINPLDLIHVLGIMPLPLASTAGAPEPGRTQWSDDGRLLGVVTRIRARGQGGAGQGGYQRLWLNPASLEPQKIELFDADRRPVIVADLEMYGHMQVRDLALGPRVAMRVSVMDVATETEVRLSMDEVEDGARRISRDAFDFEALRRTHGVDRVIDLDVQAARRDERP